MTPTRGKPVEDKANCSPFDLGVLFEELRQFSDQRKFELINNVWRPGSTFLFPKTKESGRNRRFNSSWLQDFPWLVYSRYLDGAFCLPCVLFARQCGRNSAKLDKFVKSPLTFWTTAFNRLSNHANGKCSTHNLSVIAMNNFVRVMKQEVVPVDQQLNTILQQQIAKNRTIMASLFKTVLFCGRNNIAFRGSRDEDPSNESLKGNFQALLYFRVESGDTVLQEHFETASRNATYVSKTIQNEMITTAGKYIKDQLSAEIRASKYFSVIADEATDVSNKENLSLVIRFVDSTQTIREEFVGFHLCEEGTSGRAIKNVITNAVADLGLNMNDCRGQCYDGAGNMAGRLNGASTLIKEDYNKAIYFHCMNHRLNLCIADTCSYQLVRDMMATVRKLSEFFNNSPKRQQHLVKNIKELLPNNNHEVLINVCRTRWVARIDGMDRIVEMLLPVASALEDISLNRDENGDRGRGDWNVDSRNDAQSLLNAITFTFIVAIVVVRHILDLTRPLTLKLQRKEIDLLKAKDEIALLKHALADMQRNIDVRHHQLYVEAVELAASIGVQPSMPRVAVRQVHRANAPAADPEVYYRINLTRVFLDHCTQHIDRRFQNEVYSCYKGLYLVPKVMLSNAAVWKARVREFCNDYRQDIPNIAGLDGEFALWERMWRDQQNVRADPIPDRVSDTLAEVDKHAFCNIYTILQLLATLPMSSASSERSFSTLKYLKTYLRNTMGQERLNGLALMYVHRDKNMDIEQLIDLFAQMHPRRIRMANILHDDGV